MQAAAAEMYSQAQQAGPEVLLRIVQRACWRKDGIGCEEADFEIVDEDEDKK